jgi:hypothetical protein
MLALLGRSVRLCDGITRRDSLHVGALGFTGLLWSSMLQARAGQKTSAGTFGKARACILIFNYGGPSHLDILDLKPDAPVEIRGEFQPIATRVPGLAITEHLPRLAALADKYTILRSVTHRDNDHAIGPSSRKDCCIKLRCSSKALPLASSRLYSMGDPWLGPFGRASMEPFQATWTRPSLPTAIWPPRMVPMAIALLR